MEGIMKRNDRRVVGVIILTTLLAACSDTKGFDAVTDHIPKGEQKAEEVMEPVVQVYSVAGSTDGTVFKVEERSKWIVTEASVFRDHPKALIMTSEGQQLEGALVAFNVDRNQAIVNIKNSATVEPVEQNNQAELEDMLLTQELTAADRYTLHSIYAEATIPQKYDTSIIEDYEKNIFEFNPDELQAFVVRFNDTYNKYVATGDMTALKSMILSDLLVEAFETAEDKQYLQNFKATAVTKAGFEWVVAGTADDLSLTYKIILANGQYYMTYFMIEQ